MATSGNKFWQALKIPGIIILVLWAIHIFQILFGLDLGYLGLYPRTTFGLRGILFAPLLHADFIHLINNSVPLFALSVLILYFYPRIAIRSIIFIYLLTGAGVWLFGRSVFHIGASGVVYGLVAFVFWSGIFRRSLKSVVLGLIVAFYYSGMFMGILPNQVGISWESHLIGGLVGIFVAYWYREYIEADEVPKKYSWELEEEEDQGNDSYFLKRDTFEMTKKERAEKNQNHRGGGWYSSGTW